MAIGKIHPACKQYLWGGEKLIREYGISSPNTPLAEAWVLSAHPDGDSRISFSDESRFSEGAASSEGAESSVGTESSEGRSFSALTFESFFFLLGQASNTADCRIQLLA